MMYANPLLLVQVMYSTFKGQPVNYSTRWVISENIYFLKRDCKRKIKRGCRMKPENLSLRNCTIHIKHQYDVPVSRN